MRNGYALRALRNRPDSGNHQGDQRHYEQRGRRSFPSRPLIDPTSGSQQPRQRAAVTGPTRFVSTTTRRPRCRCYAPRTEPAPQAACHKGAKQRPGDHCVGDVQEGSSSRPTKCGMPRLPDASCGERQSQREQSSYTHAHGARAVLGVERQTQQRSDTLILTTSLTCAVPGRRPPATMGT